MGGLGRAGEGWGGGRCFDVRLRIYGFTDLTPSLPLPLADLLTCIRESTFRRLSKKHEATIVNDHVNREWIAQERVAAMVEKAVDEHYEGRRQKIVLRAFLFFRGAVTPKIKIHYICLRRHAG